MCVCVRIGRSRPITTCFFHAISYFISLNIWNVLLTAIWNRVHDCGLIELKFFMQWVSALCVCVCVNVVDFFSTFYTYFQVWIALNAMCVCVFVLFLGLLFEPTPSVWLHCVIILKLLLNFVHFASNQFQLELKLGRHTHTHTHSMWKISKWKKKSKCFDSFWLGHFYWEKRREKTL